MGVLRRVGSGHDPATVIGSLARHVASATGAPGLEAAVDDLWDVGPRLPGAALPAAGEAAPDALGWAYEALARPEQRRRGLHYTPRPVADRLTAIALAGFDGDPGGPPVVCDPACGGGAFVLAAARRLAEGGVSRRVVVDEAVVGVDLDPVAVAVARTALLLWCGDAAARPRVVRADALADGDWPHRPPAGFAVVVGNPPFQSQLGSATARPLDEAARLRDLLGEGVSGYVDTAALFLLAATGQTRAGGRIVLIQPQSVLAARDAATLRRRLDALAPLEGLWVCDQPVFAAATRVCAPVLRVGLVPPSTRIDRWQGPQVAAAPSAARPEPGAWAPLAADLRGIPTVVLTAPPLAATSGATAGFRDEYYGLVPHVREALGASDERPLVTSGVIEPGDCEWGRRDVRFAKARWRSPVVDLVSLRAGNPGLARWVEERLVPKVVVATQTRVVEVAVDDAGRWVPSTPLIAVPADPDRLWHLAAALSAPPVTAWALRISSGTALVPDALKLSAAQVRQVPAPLDDRAWDDGAAAFCAAQRAATPELRRDHLLVMGRAMVAAYHAVEPEELLAWWIGRLGRRDGRDGRPGPDPTPASGPTRSDIAGGGR